MANETSIRISAIDQTKEAFRSVQANLSAMQTSIGKVTGVLAGAFAVDKIATFAKGVIDAADQLQDLADQTGFAATTLSQLGNAATLNGSSTETLNTAVVKFAKSVADANAGLTTQKEAFDALGVSLRNQDGSLKSTEELLFQVSDALANTKDGTTELKIVQDLLGRSASSLYPVLNQGSAVLKSYASTFTPEFIAASGKFNDQLDQLRINMQRLAAINLTGLLEFFNNVLGASGGEQRLQTLAKGIEAVSERLEQAQGANASGIFGPAYDVDKLRKQLQELTNEYNKVAREVQVSSQVQKTAINDVTDAFAKNTAAVIKNAEAYDPYEQQRAKIAALFAEFEKGRSASSKYYNDLRELEALKPYLTTDLYFFSLGRINDVYQDSIPAIAQYKQATKELEAQIGVANISFREFSEGAVMTLEDSLADLINGTKKASDAFRDMATSIINDLIRMYIRYTITKPLFDFLFPTLLPAGQGAPIVDRSFSSPGARAIGGSVQAGQSYMVGERGPELFVPSRSGSIVPNDQMGGGSVIINQSLNFSTGVSQTVRAEVMNMLPMISNAAKAAVADAKLRGGSFANAMR